MSIEELFSLRGRTALVTGGATGLGLHFARTLASAGARVALVARSEERLKTAKRELEDAGADVFTVTMDVTDRASVDGAIDTIERDFAPIDILVNNAGIADTQPFLDMSEEAWSRVMETNLGGTWRVSQAVARRIVARGSGGVIINIASVLGLVTQSLQCNYGTAKAGIIHLTKNLARELGRHQIRVNAIAPGYFRTDINREFFASEKGEAYVRRLFPRRTGELQELSGPLLLLASDAGSYINGVTLTVDGGTVLAGV
ncbi:MAG: SDR family oxidoreductase [Gammaproteobacteria bacterium]